MQPKKDLSEELCQSHAGRQNVFKQNPTLNYTLTIPAKIFDLSDKTAVLPSTKSVIGISNIRPTPRHFTLKGAGSKLTTLITANETGQFEVTNISNILIEGMTCDADL